MKLSDVLSAALTLTPNERLRLVDAIALVDDWQIDIVDKPQAEVEPQPKSRRGGKYYKGESLEILRRAFFRYSNQLATEKEKRQIINETAKQLGRTYSGIYNQFHKMQNGQKK
jgi:hypothetical protein